MQHKRKNGQFVTMVFITLVLLLGVFTWVNASAEEGRPTASADVGMLSKYAWCGEELSKDSIVVQLSATIAYKV